MQEQAQLSVFAKIPMAFRYMLQPGFLIVLCIYAVVTGGLAVVGFFGKIGLLVTVMFLFKCFDSASWIILGNDEEGMFEMSGGTSFILLFQLIVILMIIGVVTFFLVTGLFSALVSVDPYDIEGATMKYFWTLAITIQLVSAFVLPAVLMILIRTESFFQTLNPMSWVSYVSAIGVGRYFLTCFILLGVSFLSTLLMSFIIVSLETLGVFISSFISALVMGFHFTYLSYCSRADYIPDDEAESGELQMAAQIWQSGEREDAVSYLSMSINNTPDWNEKMPMCDMLFHYYDEMGQPDKKSDLENEMIAKVATESPQHFSFVHKTLKAKIAENESLPPVFIRTLAEQALKNHDPELAFKMTNGFAKRFPNHEDVASNYFIMGKALKDLRQPEKAYKVIAHLIKTYPNHSDVMNFKALQSDLTTKIKAKQAMEKVRAQQAGKSGEKA